MLIYAPSLFPHLGILKYNSGIFFHSSENYLNTSPGNFNHKIG